LIYSDGYCVLSHLAYRGAILPARQAAMNAHVLQWISRAPVLYGFILHLLTRSTGISLASKKFHGSIDFS
jgi:hypothetical protein